MSATKFYPMGYKFFFSDYKNTFEAITVKVRLYTLLIKTA